MRRLISLALLLWALGSQNAEADTVTFANVNVIPMDEERVLRRQTVVIRGGRIAQLGSSAQVKAPKDSMVIDGRGKFLIPGFAEMHGHLPGPDTDPETVDRILYLFLANGVTSVRGMLGQPNHLELRKEIEEGQRLGPTLYVAGPPFRAGLTAAEARSRVQEQKAAGFDLLKVLEGLRPAVYDAMAETANQVGIPFGGHVPNDVGLLHALEAGQSSIDHLDNYLEALEADDSPIRDADSATRARELGLYLDESKLPQLVEATRKAGAAVVPTMTLWETFNSDESVESMAQREELKCLPREMVAQWIKSQAQRRKRLNPEAGRRVIAVRKRVLKALHDAGVRIIFGTDAPQIFNVPGFSIHREMRIMISAGMTPYEVLLTGTRNVAEYFSNDEFGQVEVGKRGDLILLEANPLEDLAHMARRAGVMVRGWWMPESQIQAKLAELAGGSGVGE